MTGTSGPSSAEHLGVDAVVMPDLDRGQPRAAVLDDEDGPAVGVAKERAGGHGQGVGILPDDDADLDAETVAEARPGIRRARRRRRSR